MWYMHAQDWQTCSRKTRGHEHGKISNLILRLSHYICGVSSYQETEHLGWKLRWKNASRIFNQRHLRPSTTRNHLLQGNVSSGRHPQLPSSPARLNVLHRASIIKDVSSFVYNRWVYLRFWPGLPKSYHCAYLFTTLPEWPPSDLKSVDKSNQLDYHHGYHNCYRGHGEPLQAPITRSQNCQEHARFEGRSAKRKRCFPVEVSQLLR